MKSFPQGSSTEHVRAFRERMREQGLVKKDVWIRPEHAAELAAIERAMRESRDPGQPAPGDDGKGPGWSLAGIRHALAQTSAVRDGAVELETIEGAEPSLHLVMRDYGDLSVFVAVGGEQIIVEAFLWPVAQVADPSAFNAHVLATHKLLPLSTIAIQPVGGVPSYTMFGSLDAHSSLANLMFEIETLAENVIHATEAYAPYLAAEARA
jgi:uncharacterized protein YjfI (DUF2170 family)